MIVFDIETEPRPEEELRELCPPLDESQFEVGEFDPDQVKIGNLKDEAKIAAKIEKARADHEHLVATTDERLAQAREDQFAAFIAKAGLDASLSRVLVIGYYNPHRDKFAYQDSSSSERILLRGFWELMARKFNDRESAIGVNIFDFDLPYLVRRSWVLGVEVPTHLVFDLHTKWPKFHPGFVDIGKRWLVGAYGGSARWGFACLAAAFGTDGKPDGETTGANFWQQWRTDRKSALQYLESDVRQPAIWAERMGITK